MIPDAKLRPAKGMGFNHFSSNPEVTAYLEQLHELVLSVCCDCLIKQRNDEGLIYVPPERQHAKRDKNLLTMWAMKNGVRMRIMPDPEEMYNPRDHEAYLERLK